MPIFLISWSRIILSLLMQTLWCLICICHLFLFVGIIAFSFPLAVGGLGLLALICSYYSQTAERFCVSGSVKYLRILMIWRNILAHSIKCGPQRLTHLRGISINSCSIPFTENLPSNPKKPRFYSTLPPNNWPN